MGEATNALPRNAHPHCLFEWIAEKYGTGDILYLDLWPISFPMMIIANPSIANEITYVKSLPKHELNHRFLQALTGPQGISLVEGPLWKALNKMFKPAFQAGYILASVPRILNHIEVFHERVKDAAQSGKIVQLQLFTGKATFDVIAEICLGKNMNSQLAECDIAYYLDKTISWTVSTLNVVQWELVKIPKAYYGRRLNALVRAEVVERLNKTSADSPDSQRVLVDMSYDTYREMEPLAGLKDAETGGKEVSTAYLNVLVDNIKSLMLGGLDTTATAFSYTVYFLSQNPAILAKLRDEHDEVFGKATSQAASLLRTNARLINELPYTVACIRESMRMRPPGATMRGRPEGCAPETVTHPDGRILSIPAGAALFVTHFGIGRSPDHWPRPLEYIPERHLPSEHKWAVKLEYEPAKDAWRGFEKGPRACLGQELAMTEMKAMLVMVAREFDFVPAYGEEGRKDLQAPESYGGYAYQMVEFAPKPAGGMPIRVRKRKM